MLTSELTSELTSDGLCQWQPVLLLAPQVGVVHRSKSPTASGIRAYEMSGSAAAHEHSSTDVPRGSVTLTESRPEPSLNGR